jgi:hypothetical protein
LVGLSLDSENKPLKAFIVKRPAASSSSAGGRGDSSVMAIAAPDDSDPARARIKRDIMTCLKSLLNKISQRDSLSSQTNMLQGTYGRLMDTNTFSDLIYPGLDIATIKGVPRNVYELLKEGSAVRVELLKRLPKICETAFSVLEGVRRRGADRGDVMDRTTEAVLIPQISGESFAKAVVDIVKALNQLASAAYAQQCLTIASPEDERAQRDQLDIEVVRTLLGAFGSAYQDEYLAEEWAALVQADMARFLTNEKMSDIILETVPIGVEKSVTAPNKLAWVEGESVAEEYPALAEAINCLHALPFELNGMIWCIILLLLLYICSFVCLLVKQCFATISYNGYIYLCS